jgi:hypothetical protein
VKMQPHVPERGKKVTPLNMNDHDRKTLEAIATKLGTTMIGALRNMMRAQCHAIDVAYQEVTDKRTLRTGPRK